MVESELWTGQIVANIYPLKDLLAETARAQVYRTEHNGKPAAIKLIEQPAFEAERSAQLAHWKLAAKLSHPHLLRTLDCGDAELDGGKFLFVVSELAEENLAQFLPRCALTAEQTRTMLDPVLEALGYLHQNGVVLGALKPSNVLAIGDQLKLASDHIRPISEGKVTPADDIYALGATLVEALTQHPLVRNGTRQEDILAEPFRTIARHCLDADPKQRWTVDDIVTALHPRPILVTGRPAASALEEKPEDSDDHNEHVQALKHFALPIVAVVLLIVVVASMLSLGSHKKHEPVAVFSGPASAPKPLSAPVAATQAAHPEPPQGRIRQVMPEVSQKANRTIHGSFEVVVRVSVDAAGNVASATLAHRGPSRYFGKASLAAAREWHFASNAPGDRLIHFRFRRGGVSVSVSIS
jgi:TonB family protein